MFTAAILAGGQARRFGGKPKGLLSIGNKRIIDHQIEILRMVTDQIGIVTTDLKNYETLGLPFWEDLIPGAGPLGGIYTALNHSKTSETLIVASDMPFLDRKFLQYLAKISNQGFDVTILRSTDGQQPLCACYNQRCTEIIKKKIEERALKVTDFLSEVTIREIGPKEIKLFDPEDKLFFNVNSLDDYNHCLKLMNNQ